MSTRPLGPPTLLTDDPGPWSVISMVFAQAGRPGRRRPQPPMGLMLSPAPETSLPLVGLRTGATVAGVGRVAVIAAAREPAFSLRFDDEGLLHGLSPYVRRTWSVPELAMRSEERPPEDPAAGLPDPVAPGAILDEGAVPVAVAPGGEVVALHTREGRNDVIALLHTSDGTLVRWVRGARAAAWSADGAHFALGGPWGVVLTAGREAPAA